MEIIKKKSSFFLSSLIRQQKDPILALNIFLNPNLENPNLRNPNKPFNYSLVTYDLIITKLGRANLFDELRLILSKLKDDTRIKPTEVIFCNVIKYYARAGLIDNALQVFVEMPEFRCRRTVKSLNTLLNGLLICKEFGLMRRVFEGMSRFFSPDVCTFNVMINCCRVRGDEVAAWGVFDEMVARRVRPNDVTFATLVGVYCDRSRFEEAFKIVRDMSRVYDVEPNVFVYSSFIKALCEKKELGYAFRLKDEMLERKIVAISAVYNTLITGLFTCGRMGEVQGVLDEMEKTKCRPSIATYNALIAGFCGEDRFDLAIRVLDDMEGKGCKPDVISFNTIIRAYVNAGKLGVGVEFFEDMPRRGFKPDVVSYRILVQGLVDGMKLKEVAFYLDEMIFKGFSPCPVAINKYVECLVREENYELLFEVLDSLAKGNCIDNDSWRLAISVVSKKSELLGFRDLFDELTDTISDVEGKGCKPDVISFDNTIIREYVNAGKLGVAVEFFEDMPRRGFKPDVVTYRTLVQGLVDGMKLKEVAFYLDEMIFKGFSPCPVAVNKYVECLVREENYELLCEVLDSLAKGKCIDNDSLRLVISTVSKKSKLLGFRDRFDALIDTISDA